MSGLSLFFLHKLLGAAAFIGYRLAFIGYRLARGHAVGMCHALLESSRRGGRFEYRHVCTHAVDMPSTMPI